MDVIKHECIDRWMGDLASEHNARRRRRPLNPHSKYPRNKETMWAAHVGRLGHVHPHVLLWISTKKWSRSILYAFSPEMQKAYASCTSWRNLRCESSLVYILVNKQLTMLYQIKFVSFRIKQYSYHFIANAIFYPYLYNLNGLHKPFCRNTFLMRCQQIITQQR